MPRARKPPKRRPRASRIFWRGRRAWADFRDYADVGGGREPLKAPLERYATTDPLVAEVLCTRRLENLDAIRRGRVLPDAAPVTTLAAYAVEHLKAKGKAGKVTPATMRRAEQHLQRAVDFLGARTDLRQIEAPDVRRWAQHLDDAGLSGGTVRHHLNDLSNLYRRAVSDGRVPGDCNPVKNLLEKPTARREEARWLEVHEAAALLEAARTYRPKRDDLAYAFAYPLVATFLLTGGRRAEVLGLEPDDVSFDRRTVTFRPNDSRRLKTLTSARVVPLWPQLESILRAWVFDMDRPPGRLLFTGRDGKMVRDLRKMLDAVAAGAGWKPGEIRTKMFRHTYCAARLQTLDRGAPVSEFTVGRELGHSGDALVKRVYGHLGTIRHRSDVVEYRVNVAGQGASAPWITPDPEVMARGWRRYIKGRVCHTVGHNRETREP